MKKFYYGIDSVTYLDLLKTGKLEANTPVTPYKQIAESFGNVILKIKTNEYIKGANFFKIGETSLNDVTICDIEDQ